MIRQIAIAVGVMLTMSQGWSARVSDEELALVKQNMPQVKLTPKKDYKVLCFSKPYGFPHSSIHIAKEMAKEMGRSTGLFSVDFSEDAKDLSAENLKKYDAIYLNNTTKMEKGLTTPEAREGFLDFVRNGGGIIAVHAATDGGWPGYVDMIGGDFDGHPWGHKGTYCICNEDCNHPIVKDVHSGKKSFDLSDELYQYKNFDRKKCRVLLSVDTSKFINHRGGMKREDMDYALAWVKDYGKGRVFVSSLGHNEHVYYDKDILKMWLQGFRFALGDLDVDTTSKEKPDYAKWQALPEEGKPHPEGRIQSHEESLKSIEVQEDYSLELVAGDDMLDEPVVCVWDGNGRMYVAQFESYMQDIKGSNKDAPISRVLRLEDTNNDGIMDKRTVFADKLLSPRVILPLKDWVIIGESNTNDLYAYRDKDGDGVAEEKKLWYEGGKRGGNVEHQESGLIWGIDNHLYLARGDYRLRYLGGDTVTKVSTKGDGGQWGLTQDNSGHVIFSNAGTGEGPIHVNVPINYSKWKPKWEQAEGYRRTFAIDQIADAQGGHGAMNGAKLKGFTATCGQSVFRGDRLPKEMIGEMFFGEPVGRMLRRTTIKTDDMGRRILHNAYADQQKEFIASTDANFRPVNTATGPDGTLYIVDMHRGIIQEGAWVPEGSFIYNAIRHYGLDKNIGHGRIYRVRHPDFKPGPKPNMLNETPAQLVEHLAHPNGWWRDEAQKLIVISQDKSVIPALQKMVADHDNKLTRLHALWTLEGLGALSEDYLKTVLSDSDATVRAAAIRNLEPYFHKDITKLSLIEPLTKDADVVVAKQIILSMSTKTTDETRAIAEAVLTANASNTYLKELDLELNRAYFEEQKRLADLAKLNAQERELMEAGTKHYQGLCASCHGADGKGVIMPTGQMMAPSFINNPRIIGSKRVLTHIALSGFTGPIDGKTYGGVMMAPLKDNDDHYLASALTYIRKSFGNDAEMITPEEVADVRGESTGIAGPFTETTIRDLQLNTGGNPKLWKLATSHKPQLLEALADDDPKNTWASKSSIKPGMYVEADFPHDRRVFKVKLLAKGGDFPPAVKVETSMDGSTWKTVATHDKCKTYTEIKFPAVIAKKVRVVATAEKGKWWQLYKLDIVGPGMGDIDQYPTNNRQYLSVKKAKKAKTGWGKIQDGKAIGGGKLVIAGTKYSKGFGAHSNSEIVFDLAGKDYKRFFANAGHCDAGFETKLIMEVHVDGKKAFSSGDMEKGDPAKPVDINIAGAKELKLLVLAGSDGETNGDHACWADACFIKQ